MTEKKQQLTDEKLQSKVLLRLEKLTRQCFELARGYWVASTRTRENYRKMEDVSAEKIALCLSEILGMVYEGKPDNVFFAPRYRGTGKFKIEPGRQKAELLGDYKELTWKYGRYVRGGRLIERTNMPFMPVSFWNQQIYERPLEFFDKTGNKRLVTISGFSGWTAEHGFLGHSDNHEDSPIFGFHFQFTGNRSSRAEFGNGILRFCLPKTTPPFELTKAFREAFYKSNYFYRGEGRDKHEPSNEIDHPFPVITGISDLPSLCGVEKRIAEAVFSTLFYSNFKALAFDKSNVADLVDLLGRELVDNVCCALDETEAAKTPYRSFAELVANLFREYYSFEKKATKEGENGLLTFKHYYAFLLNPSLDFGKPGGKDSAIGTVNIYTEKPIPTMIAAFIRKHLESIFHFNRQIEDWEESNVKGAESAFSLMNAAMGHEIGKVYSTADRLQANRRAAEAQDDFDIVYEVTRKALQYGMLWGSSSLTEIPPDAQLWDDYGEPCRHDRYVTCLVRESWQIFLVAEVLREMTMDQLGEDALENAARLWKAGEQMPVNACSNPETRIVFPRGFPESRSQRQQLSRALYRWMLAVMSNAWKHIVAQASEGTAELKTKEVDSRLEIVATALTAWQSIAQTGQAILSVHFDRSKQEGIEVSVSNCYAGKMKPKEQPQGLKGTLLVMVLAGQEIWEAQGEQTSIDIVKNNSHFGPGSDNSRWISRLQIPKLIIE